MILIISSIPNNVCMQHWSLSSNEKLFPWYAFMCIYILLKVQHKKLVYNKSCHWRTLHPLTMGRSGCGTLTPGQILSGKCLTDPSVSIYNKLSMINSKYCIGSKQWLPTVYELYAINIWNISRSSHSSIQTSISNNHMTIKVWDEFTCPFPNFNGWSLGMDK